MARQDEGISHTSLPANSAVTIVNTSVCCKSFPVILKEEFMHS